MAFNQDHDTFYYKMYFDLLKVILKPEFSYNIYTDIKDTKSQNKVEKLQDVLRNNHCLKGKNTLFIILPTRAPMRQIEHLI